MPLVQFGHFDFDFVHDQNCGQDDVFYTTVRPLVHKLIEVCMLFVACHVMAIESVSIWCHFAHICLARWRQLWFSVCCDVVQGKSSAVLLYGASKTGKTYTVEVMTTLCTAG